MFDGPDDGYLLDLFCCAAKLTVIVIDLIDAGGSALLSCFQGMPACLRMDLMTIIEGDAMLF